MFGLTAFGQTIIATTDDGEKVILKSDKTWEFAVKRTPEIENPIRLSFVNFTGDNIEELKAVTLANRKELVKSDFETLKQYFSRLEILINQIKFKDKPLANSVIVRTPEFRYNAEDQFFLGYTHSGNDVQFLKKSDSSYPFSSDSLNLRFSLSPEKAREAASDLKVAIYGFPVDTNTLDLKFYPTKIVYFNYRSGEIYKTTELTVLNETLKYERPVPAKPAARPRN